jgi:hypothetical protein
MESTRTDMFIKEQCWEWLLSGNLPASFTADRAGQVLKAWRLKAAMLTSMTLAIDPVFVRHNGNHLHALILGRNFKNETTLENVPEEVKRRVIEAWTESVREVCGVHRVYRCTIKDVYSRTIIEYLESNRNMATTTSGNRSTEQYEQLPLYMPRQIEQRTNIARMVGLSITQAKKAA